MNALQANRSNDFTENLDAFALLPLATENFFHYRRKKYFFKKTNKIV